MFKTHLSATAHPKRRRRFPGWQWMAIAAWSTVVVAQNPLPPLSLKAAVDEALLQNPGIQAQQSRLTAADAAVQQARSAYYPRVDIEATFTNGDDPVYVFGSLLRQGEFGPRNFDPALLNNPSPLNNFDHRVSVSQVIYDGGRRERQVSMARLGEVSNREGLRATEQQLIFNVIRDYYRILLADEAVRVARESLSSAEASLRTMRERETVGMAVKSDAMRLEVQAADYRRTLLSAEGDTRTARQALELDLGREPQGQVLLSDTLSDRALTSPAVESLKALAAQQRPDLKQAAVGTEMARDRTRIARAGFWPTVGFQGSYDFNHGTSTGLGNQYLLAVRLQFNLFDAGAKAAALRQARAEQNAAELGKRQIEQQIQWQVSAAHDRQSVARAQYQVAKQAGQWAEESLRIVRNRHEAGLATVTDLLSALTAWHQSRLSALQALYNFYVEYAGLELAAGTLTTQSNLLSN